ncbi:MAG: pseudouridine synthase [Clostridiales bacterium]|nr:pseudouridine synthase [Clostridiales bacterium]
MAKKKKIINPFQDNGTIRINKYLSDAGFCSRRQADRYIEEGKVTIDGQVAKLGDRVVENQEVRVNGRLVTYQEELILIAFNKPVGVECTEDRRVPNNIIDYINYGKRISYIGRLDKDSQGLILLTNDGDLNQAIAKGSNYHEKEYVVRVNKPITDRFIEGMSGPVPILGRLTRPSIVTPIDKYTFKIIITQGMNRQIRRMCEYFGYRVTKLKRIRVMNITLGRLKEGTYRNVTEKELEELKAIIENKENEDM